MALLESRNACNSSSICCATFVEGLDHPAPGFLLTVVDFAEIEHLALRDLALDATLALDNAPISLLLVLEASIRAANMGRRLGLRVSARSSRSFMRRSSTPT
jgi:hypothetical protein